MAESATPALHASHVAPPHEFEGPSCLESKTNQLAPSDAQGNLVAFLLLSRAAERREACNTGRELPCRCSAGPKMPPLAPPAADHKPWPRHQRHADKAAGAPVPALAPREPLVQRRASFHGRGTHEHQEQQQRDHLLRQRPRTHPDLLAGVRERGFLRAGVPGGNAAAAAVPWGRRAAPSKALVTVAVQRSMWPLHVMASAEWRVADLVAAAVELYVREGRRPLLPSADPSAFGLHYSQFSLESLEPGEKLMELGSRSFFLCPRATAAPSTRPATEASKAMPTSADRPNMLPPWLGFVHFWPLL